MFFIFEKSGEFMKIYNFFVILGIFRIIFKHFWKCLLRKGVAANSP